MDDRQPLTPADVIRLTQEHSGKAQVDHFVGGVAGLSLRIGSKSASWVLRGRVRGLTTVRTWTIGRYPEVTLSQARTRASAALDMAREGTDPSEWLTGMKPPKARKEEKAVVTTAMSYTEAVDAFLESREATTRPATVRSYRLNLKHGVMVKAFDTLADIDADAVRKLVKTWSDAGKRMQARNCLRDLRTLLRWCESRNEAGLRPGVIQSLETITVPALSKARAREAAREKLPSEVELGEFLWKLDGHQSPLHIRLALTLLMLTGQRIFTLRQTEASEFVDGEWRIPGAHMKSGRNLTLPLPTFTWAVSEALLKAVPNADGPLFPQSRAKHKGDELDGLLSYKVFSDAYRECLDGHTPHSVRYALTSHGEDILGLRRVSIQAILDQQEASVLEKSYQRGDKGRMISEALQAWETWLLSITRKDDRLPRFLPEIPAQ